ncbi:hypothetical protein [Enhygromyxa salina]|nr:hypothetical protein [Enhygromyxa salina]
MIDIIKIFRRYPTQLTLAAALMTVTGCEIGLHIDGLYPDEQGEDESGGPDTCVHEFDDCLTDAGNDPAAISACHDVLLGCLGEGDEGWAESSSGDEPPPPDDCAEQFDQCLQYNPDPAVCEEEFEACNGGGDDWGSESSDGGEDWGGESGDGGDGGDDGCDPPQPCEEQLDICLQENPEDPDGCFIAFDECLGGEPPPPPTPCDQDLEACLELPVDPELCFFEYDECLGQDPHPPSPCEDQLDACMEDNPMDPDGCLIGFEECMGNDPAPPDECEQDFDQCVYNALDDADLLLCEAQFDACLEP